MNLLPTAITKVVESFEKLPGVGPKTATRLAFYLLHVPEEELTRFSDSLLGLKKNTVLCSVCRTVSDSDPCPVCSSPERDHALICVVEQTMDLLSIERTGSFKGIYHVLHGSLDPLNNIGPDEIYMSDLFSRINKQSDPVVSEVILAMNPKMEGEATAMYISKEIHAIETKLGRSIKLTRLAHGLPIGADIEYADEVTLRRAMDGRRDY
jgi:recombination protein RecR